MLKRIRFRNHSQPVHGCSPTEYRLMRSRPTTKAGKVSLTLEGKIFLFVDLSLDVILRYIARLTPVISSRCQPDAFFPEQPVNQSKILGRTKQLPALSNSAAAIALAVIAGGCDGPPSSSSETAPTMAESAANAPDRVDKLRKAKFLNLTENEVAAEWLALQEHREDPSYRPSSGDIAEFEQRIKLLARYTQEDRRMVANRTVQTRDLLAEHDVHETLLTLLDGMADVAEAHVVGNYGTYCQWYVNLRQGRLDHRQALQQMMALKRAP